MKQQNEKYNEIVNLLKRSKPGLDSYDDIEREVIKRISRSGQSIGFFSGMIDFLFSWVYIGWVRKSLITASVFLILVFVYQQGVILRQINYLSRQTIIDNGESTLSTNDAIEKKLLIYKFTKRGLPSKNNTVSGKDIQILMKSVNEMQEKYKDLINLINEDPELKEIIEKKLLENNRTKINL